MSALSRLDLHHASLLLTALTLALSLTAGCAVPPAGANDFPCRTKSTLVVDTSGRLHRLPGQFHSEGLSGTSKRYGVCVCVLARVFAM